MQQSLSTKLEVAVTTYPIPNDKNSFTISALITGTTMLVLYLSGASLLMVVGFGLGAGLISYELVSYLFPKKDAKKELEKPREQVEMPANSNSFSSLLNQSKTSTPTSSLSSSTNSENSGSPRIGRVRSEEVFE